MAFADDILVIGGSGSPELTGRICDELGVPQGHAEAIRRSHRRESVSVLFQL